MIKNLPLAALGISAILVVGTIFLLIWNKPIFVIYMQFAFSCFMRFLYNELHFPDAIKYFSDFLTIILLIQVILQFRRTKTLNIRKPLFFIILFLLASIVSILLNKISLIFFIWGIRVNFRFFVFFLACTIFLKQSDIDKLINFMFILLPINFILVIFQYFILGNRDDYIGGLYGTMQGCNSELVLYLTIVMIITIIFYIYNKIGNRKIFTYLLMICLIGVLAELKIIFFVLPLFIFIIFILSFPNKRAILISIAGVGLLIISLPLFLFLYPNWSNFFSVDQILHYISDANYGSNVSTSLNRMSAGSYIMQNILINPIQKLFGIGLGNANVFLSIPSRFYQRYHELNYIYFLYSFLLIEIGIIGLIIYCLFFASIIYESIRIRKKMKTNDNYYYCYICFLLSLFVFQMIIYNVVLNMDGSTIIYFIMSIPFIMEKEMYERNISLTNNRIFSRQSKT